MRDFMAKAQEVAANHKQVFSAERGPVFSFDNAPIHQGAALLKELQLDGAKRASLPPSSPDMHKCIEHVFGTLTRAMAKSIRSNMNLSTAAAYKAEIVRLFYSVITPSSVQKDVASLKATYEEIKKVEGDWPEQRFR